MAAQDPRGYEAALATLDKLVPKAGPPPGPPNQTQLSNLEAMKLGMEKVGISQEDLTKLKVVHIAGTKGKGSTSVMTEAILRSHGVKTGLYTSPHLRNIRERIHVDGRPISEEAFAKHFWATWDALQLDKGQEDEAVPRTNFFRFLTLMALRAFRDEKVDMAVLEVGLGGRLDATNAVQKPVVCGITHIGFDHEEVLGNTLPKIASEKAGIMKEGIPCITSPGQEESALAQIRSSSTAAKAPLAVAARLDAYEELMGVSKGSTALGLQGSHQRENASVAIALAAYWLKAVKGVDLPDIMSPGKDTTVPFALPEAFTKALASATWEGRCQKVPCNNTTFFIDGAHTDSSVALAFKWFLEASNTTVPRKVLFSCQKGRSPHKLLRPIATLASKEGIEKVIITPMISSKTSLFVPQGGSEANPWLKEQLDAWEDLQKEMHSEGGGVPAELVTSLPDLLDACKASDRPQHIFATGSLYLVGDILQYLAP